MRARSFVVTASLALALAAAPPAHALVPDPTEAAKIALLAKIVKALEDTYHFLHRINGEVRDMRTRLARHFPLQALNEIKSVFRTARTIEDEISDLSCNWRLSVRARALKLALQGLGDFCRDEYTLLFGAALPGPDQDLREMRGYMGVLRYKQAADQVQAAKEAAEQAAALSDEARAAGNPDDPSNPHSAAYSTRLLALGEAHSLKAEASLNGLAALDLEAAQEDLDAERREDWQRGNAARVMTLWLTQYHGADPGARP